MTADAPSAGGLLLATPGMHNAVFDRTVIMLLEHHDEASMGLVLNRPSTIAAGAVLPQIAGLAEPDVVFLGGPVEEGTALVLAEPTESAQTDLHYPRNGIGLVDLTDPDPMIGSTIARVRVYSGYAGWGPGQLEEELRAGAWITAEAVPTDLWHTDSDVLWASVLRRQHGLTRFLASYPDQPWLN